MTIAYCTFFCCAAAAVETAAETGSAVSEMATAAAI
jgi:hypothetical protein